MISTLETMPQYSAWGRDDELLADEQDIREYLGQSSIGFDPEYLLRELLWLLFLD